MKVFKKDRQRTIASYILSIINIIIVVVLLCLAPLEFITIKWIAISISILGIILTIILSLVAEKAPYSRINTLIIKSTIILFIIFIVFLTAACVHILYK